MANLGQRIAQLPAEKRALLEGQLIKAETARTIAPTTHAGEHYPLSYSQQRMWFLEQLDSQKALYNVPVAWRLCGTLHVAMLHRALEAVVARHASLRTRFVTTGDTPEQVIASPQTVALTVIDQSVPSVSPPVAAPAVANAARSPGEPEVGSSCETTLQRLLREEAQRPFCLDTDLLLRCTLIRLAEQDHVLLLTMHHIASDGWSVGVMLRELAAFYKAFLVGLPPGLPTLPIQYPDFAVWQRNWLRTSVLEKQLAFWRRRLEGAPPVLELPTDRPRPATQTFRGAHLSLTMSSSLSASLTALSQSERVTLFMTLLAGFQIMLARYSGQEDVVVGTPTAGRTHSELEGMVGLFVNTLVLRTDLSGRPTFRELMKRVREVTLEAYSHQDVPFDKLVEELQPERSLSYSPLFQVMFVLQNASLAPPEFPGLELTSVPVETGTAKFDLMLTVTPEAAEFRVEWEYNTDLFDAATITRMMSYYRTLLEGIVADPQCSISKLPLLPERERRQILVEWNQTVAAFPQDCRLHQLFEGQMERTPDRVAVEFRDQQLSYRELEERANQLARHLRKIGVGPDVLVAICVERSLELVVGILGILKAGGGYLPLDPDYPADRLAYMLDDAAAPVLLSQAHLIQRLPRAPRTICLDRDWQTIAKESHARNQEAVVAESAAYAIYTSGSTGLPKAAVIPHRAIVNHMFWMNEAFPLTDSDAVLQKTPCSFDASVWEFFAPLMAGSRLVMAEPGGHREPRYLINTIQRRAVTILQLGPVLLHLLLKEEELERCRSLRRVFCGGEALPLAWARQLVDTLSVEVCNLYGPTEAAIDATFWRSEPTGARFSAHVPTAPTAPIGRPIANTQVYVLDSDLEPVGIGVPGELFIGGSGLARGYLNRADLTAEWFVTNPFSNDSRSRLYRTGDRVRWLADGNLEFLGRFDHQVKVRGLRVELEEIEAVLRRHQLIRNASVAARGDFADEKRLVAYVVPRIDQGLDLGELRRHLRRKLPEYMVPASFVVLKELPLTPNGKVDRRALPAPNSRRRDLEEQHVAPNTAMQALICGIWTEILNLERLGIHDNFFDLGGHSLLAMRVVARLRDTVKRDVPLRTLFECPTIALLADNIDKRREVPTPTGDDSGSPLAAAALSSLAGPPVTRVASGGALPLSFAQQRLWFLAQLDPDSISYHIRFAWRLEGPLDVEVLGRCLSEIVRRHEVLRTTYQADAGTPLQRIAPPTPLGVVHADLRGFSGSTSEQELLRVAGSLDRPFDLARDTMLRAGLVRLAEQEHVLILTFHHIALDAWSLEIFLRELETLYSAFSNNKASPLAELPVQYADFAVWQRESMQGEVLDRHLAYWRKQLEGAPALLELPTDKPRPTTQRNRGAHEELIFTKELTRAIEELSRQEGATLFMTLLAAFKVLLCRYSSQEDIVIGTPIAGRKRLEVEPLIGFFLNTLVLRSNLSGDPTFRELLAQVRETTLGAYEHQDLPFDRLVEELHPERRRSHAPVMQVMFVLENSAGRYLRLPGVHARYVEMENRTAKFDLLLAVTTDTSEIRTSLEYNTDLFESATIVRMLGHYQKLLEAIVAEPHSRVRKLPLLTDGERHQILVDWTNTHASPRVCRGIHELFETQAGRTPHRSAVEFQDQRLSYRALNERANQLAHHLQKLGAGPDVLVGVCLERSLDLVIGVLAILKAGAACVPLDPSYPLQRLAFMVQDSGLSLLLSQSALVERLPRQSSRIVCLDRDCDVIAQEDGANPRSSVTPHHLVYVMYTSGSTGLPKGVALPHRALINLVAWQGRHSHAREGARTLQYASFSFDVSFQELFATWGHGGTLVLAEETVRRDFRELATFVAAQHIQRLFLPFVALQHFATAVVAQPSLSFSLEEIITAGEQLQVTPAITFMYRQLSKCVLVNQYGPTESHVATAYNLGDNPEDWPKLPPIGRPIDNAECYVLDAHRQPVPIGVPGELYIGGVGLARGYRNRPALTAERFITHPFRNESGARLYQTGDLVRWLSDGNLEFLGRIDHQVKIRGFRVELGEVETILGSHPQVKESVVAVRQDDPGEKRLVAYVVPRLNLKSEPAQSSGPLLASDLCPLTSDLRAYLEERIPDYMVPAVFVMIKELPLTPTGKVDRQMLPAPSSERPRLNHAYAAARTPREELLAKLWAEILGLKTVGINDNFFELGGHSLLAVKLFARIEIAFGRKLPLATLFEHPTIAGIERLLQQPDRRGDKRILVQVQTGVSRRPLFFAPSAGGEAFFCKPMAGHLGADQSIWTFQVPEQDGRRKPFANIESMAAFFVDELIRSQMHGPYFLAGYSFGAAVALEMAQQLRARGEPIALLAILDWGFLPPKPPTVGKLLGSAWASFCNLPYWLADDFLRTPYKQRLPRFAREMQEVAHRLRDPWAGSSTATLTAKPQYDPWLDSLDPEYRVLIATHLRALAAYKARPYPGPVTLLRARARDLLASSVERDYGWGKIAAGGADVRVIPGNHHTILQEPNVRVLARELRRALAKAHAELDVACSNHP
jgi:amino acid adenylation domain-containing protein